MQTKFITGWQSRFIFFLIRLNVLWLALCAYRNPVLAVRVLRAILKVKRNYIGQDDHPRLVKSGGRYFWSIASAGWPSRAYDKFIRYEMNKVRPLDTKENLLQTIIFSITSRCPLQCEHCYEWNNLSGEEILSLENLQEILRKFQAYGVCNIEFSGGEPLSRFDDLLQLIQSAQRETDIWILTSGFGLTLGKAQALKQAGLTGVVISLDHWSEEQHNQFRHNDKSFHWVKTAAAHATQVDLVTAFSLCANKDFVTMANLTQYLQLAKDSGAFLVRILEPRQVGHFKGQDIELNEAEADILKGFYQKSLSDPAFKDLPIIEYTGFYQRTHGCLGNGNRYLYIDSKGDIHACPFCQIKVGNALTDSLEDVIPKLKRIGCHKFKTKITEAEVIAN